MNLLKELIYRLRGEKLMINATGKKTCFFIAGGTLIFLVFLMYQTPLISDDFIFAGLQLHDFSEVMNYVLHYGNGRVMGNLGAVVSVNTKMMCAIVRAIIIFAIIYAMCLIVEDEQGPNLFPVAFLLILGVSPDVFGQVFVWTSGFMNYTPPILCLLICVYIVRIAPKQGAFLSSILLVIGFAGQLYVEHNTVINLVIALVMSAYYLKTQDRVRLRASVIWFSGCLLGAMVMLLVPILFGASTSPLTNYRNVAVSLDVILMNTKDCVLSTLFFYSQCTMMWIAASTAMLVVMDKKTSIWNCIRKMVYIGYPVVSLISNIGGEQVQSIWSAQFILPCGGLAIYLFCMGYDQVLQIREKKIRHQLLNLLLLILISLAPFCVVRPFAARCIFLSYIFACVYVMKIISWAMNHHKSFSWREKRFLSCAAIGLAIILCFEFWNIGMIDRARTEYIEKSMLDGDSTIRICEFPSRYTYETWLVGRKYYYEVCNDIEFIVVDYDEWMKIK